MRVRACAFTSRGFGAGARTPAARQSGNWFCPIVENLEDRCLPSSYTVNTFNDILHDITPGELTLRDALTAISTQAASGNAIAGTASNIVQFAIGNTGSVQSINVGSGNVLAALPALTHQVVIDGRSQGGVGYSGPPLIGLNGASAGANADGLEFDAGSDGSQVDGLVIQQFGANGIEINGASGNLITGNYIGTDVAGATSLGNGNDGILVSSGATTNLIGGTLATAANVISGNGNPGTLTGNGVELSGIGTSHNTVAGNFIGTDKAGAVAIGNVIDGIRIDVGASDNTIGGTTAGAANVISGGLNVASSSPPGTQAAVFSLGNATITGTSARFDIAVNYTDTALFQMVYAGIDVRPSSAALAPVDPGTGQPDFSAFNFVPSSLLGTNWGPVANIPAGEFVYHTPPSSGGTPSGLAPNKTYLIGTLTYDLSRFGIVPSSSLTVSIKGIDTVLGAQVPGLPNTFAFVSPTFTQAQQPLVPGKATGGVAIDGAGTSNNVVEGNLIGTNVQNTSTLGHLTNGVIIDASASNNTVGGDTSGAGNVVAGNDNGVTLAGTGTSGNAVQGNQIGTNNSGASNLGNILAGVLVENGASVNKVGGTTAGSGNTIANGGTGVVIGSSPADTTTTGDSVLGNDIHGNSGSAIAAGQPGPDAQWRQPTAISQRWPEFATHLRFDNRYRFRQPDKRSQDNVPHRILRQPAARDRQPEPGVSGIRKRDHRCGWQRQFHSAGGHAAPGHRGDRHGNQPNDRRHLRVVTRRLPAIAHFQSDDHHQRVHANDHPDRPVGDRQRSGNLRRGHLYHPRYSRPVLRHARHQWLRDSDFCAAARNHPRPIHRNRHVPRQRRDRGRHGHRHPDRQRPSRRG